jgi:hypothetical protein
MVMSPAGLGPENDYTGEGQQQLYTADILSSERMLYTYDRKFSVGKKLLVVSLKELVAKTN